MQLSHLFPLGPDGAGSPKKQGSDTVGSPVDGTPDRGGKPGQQATASLPKSAVRFLTTLHGALKIAPLTNHAMAQDGAAPGELALAGTEGRTPRPEAPEFSGDAVAPDAQQPAIATQADRAVPGDPEGQFSPPVPAAPVAPQAGFPDSRGKALDPRPADGPLQAASRIARGSSDPFAIDPGQKINLTDPADTLSPVPADASAKTVHTGVTRARPDGFDQGASVAGPAASVADSSPDALPMAARPIDAVPPPRFWHAGTIATAVQRRLAETDTPGVRPPPVTPGATETTPAKTLPLAGPPVSAALSTDQNGPRPTGQIHATGPIHANGPIQRHDLQTRPAAEPSLGGGVLPATSTAGTGPAATAPDNPVNNTPAQGLPSAGLADRPADTSPASRPDRPAAPAIMPPTGQPGTAFTPQPTAGLSRTDSGQPPGPAPRGRPGMAESQTAGVARPPATDRAPIPRAANDVVRASTVGPHWDAPQKQPDTSTGPTNLPPPVAPKNPSHTRSEVPAPAPMALVAAAPPAMPRTTGLTPVTETALSPILVTGAETPPQPQAVEPGGRMAQSPQPSPLDQALVRQIAYVIERTRDGAIRVELDPPELGSVTLRVQGTGDTLSVVLLGERGETVDLLRRNLDPLTQELQKLGYGTVDIDLGGRQKRPAPPPPLNISEQTSPDPASEPASHMARPGPNPQTGLDLRL